MNLTGLYWIDFYLMVLIVHTVSCKVSPAFSPVTGCDSYYGSVPPGGFYTRGVVKKQPVSSTQRKTKTKLSAASLSFVVT